MAFFLLSSLHKHHYLNLSFSDCLCRLCLEWAIFSVQGDLGCKQGPGTNVFILNSVDYLTNISQTFYNWKSTIVNFQFLSVYYTLCKYICVYILMYVHAVCMLYYISIASIGFAL